MVLVAPQGPAQEPPLRANSGRSEGRSALLRSKLQGVLGKGVSPALLSTHCIRGRAAPTCPFATELWDVEQVSPCPGTNSCLAGRPEANAGSGLAERT